MLLTPPPHQSPSLGKRDSQPRLPRDCTERADAEHKLNRSVSASKPKRSLADANASLGAKADASRHQTRAYAKPGHEARSGNPVGPSSRLGSQLKAPRVHDFGSVCPTSSSVQTQADSVRAQRAAGAHRQEVSCESSEESSAPAGNVWIGITVNQATGIRRHTCSFVPVVSHGKACGHSSGMTH